MDIRNFTIFFALTSLMEISRSNHLNGSSKREMKLNILYNAHSARKTFSMTRVMKLCNVPTNVLPVHKCKLTMSHICRHYTAAMNVTALATHVDDVFSIVTNAEHPFSAMLSSGTFHRTREQQAAGLIVKCSWSCRFSDRIPIIIITLRLIVTAMQYPDSVYYRGCREAAAYVAHLFIISYIFDHLRVHLPRLTFLCISIDTRSRIF